MRMFFRLFAIVFLFLLAVSPSHAAELEFKKGLNLSSWLANAPRQPIFHMDFLKIKRAGFDHVRIPVNPEQFGFVLSKKSKGIQGADFYPVDRAISLANLDGLPVILNIHPMSTFMKTVEEKDWAEQKFIDMWVDLAKRYKSYPADSLAFELMNEPQYYDNEDKYNVFIANVVSAIREVDQNRILIVGGPHGSSINGLQELQPFDDPKIYYAFHYYEPYIVSHQGMHFGFEGLMIPYFRKLPYPSDRVNHDASYYAPAAPDLDQAQDEIDEYVEAGWNAQHIAERIQAAKDWADEHNAKVICSEFGVLRNHIDPASRYRWIKDTRKALEANGFGWELWDYTDLFGITTLTGKTHTDPVDGSVWLDDPKKGKRTIEPEAIDALGLEGS